MDPASLNNLSITPFYGEGNKLAPLTVSDYDMTLALTCSPQSSRLILVVASTEMRAIASKEQILLEGRAEPGNRTLCSLPPMAPCNPSMVDLPRPDKPRFFFFFYAIQIVRRGNLLSEVRTKDRLMLSKVLNLLRITSFFGRSLLPDSL